MAFRFWRRIRIAPGVTLNLSKSTASLSFGPRGAKYTVSPHGNRATAGLPGTGLFYTVHEPRRPSAVNAPRVAQRDRLNLGFFQRLFTPVDERALVDGLKALNTGDEGAALAAFEKAAGLPDAAWMAGMLQLRRSRPRPGWWTLSFRSGRSPEVARHEGGSFGHRPRPSCFAWCSRPPEGRDRRTCESARSGAGCDLMERRRHRRGRAAGQS
ncbi:MAG: DUF4236 domain-containing protein [Alphaproteobacteria bacterium]|nr:DUF4236 domain-containing protein [Alphaproteobacteria bacterium]MBM3611560.1 DUF4236 domain-containing protein [Alphaproteobacteria bacterium]